MRRQGLPSVGSSILELTIVLVVTLSMLLGAVAVGDLLIGSYRASRALDLISYDHALKPLVMQSDGSIMVNEHGLSGGVAVLADRISEMISSEFDVDSSEFMIEVSIAIADINERTGVVQSVQFPSRLSTRRGDHQPSSALLERTDLRREFERVSGAVGEKSPFAYLVPGAPADAAQYVPFVPMLGARLIFRSEEGAMSRLLADMGVLTSDALYDWKVTALRGEFGAL